MKEKCCICEKPIKGNGNDVTKYLKEARKSASLAKREATDVEFVDYR